MFQENKILDLGELQDLWDKMSLKQLNDEQRILFLQEFISEVVINSVENERLKKKIEIDLDQYINMYQIVLTENKKKIFNS